MIPALDVMRCPVCRGRLAEGDGGLRCAGCSALYAVEDGIPRMLDDRLPGIAEKRGEIAGWVEMAKRQGWYEPDDELDAHLPYLTRDCGWEDKTWRANEHSFDLLLERVKPGMRVLEVGAAKGWAAQHLVPRGVEYVATDILADPNIGIGRGAFFESRVGPFARVQADGEHLPFADGAFDVAYCVAALHHALDLSRMVGEMARVTRRGGIVCALNEGTRAVGSSGENEDQSEEKELGINEHVHSLYAYLWAFWRAGLWVRRVEHAEGDADLRDRRIGGRLLRVPGVGRSAATWFAQTCYGYSGVSLFAVKLPVSLSVNVMTRGPGDRVAAMLALFRGIADEILVALDDRAGAEVESPLAAAADRLIRYPYAEPVDRPLAWLHTECRGDWVLTIDDDEIPSRALLDALPELVRAKDVTHYWLPRRWLHGELDQFLDAHPWRPDYQPRLVLNDPGVLSFPTETHVPVRVLGPCRYLDAGLYHLDTLVNTREAREEKVRRYERSHPGKRVAGRPLNEAYYLPELVGPPTQEVPPADLELIAGVLGGAAPSGARAEVGAVTREEIDRHWAGREPGYEAALALLEDVPPLRAGGRETVDVLVENRSAGTWPWGGAGGPEIRLGSRWRREGAVVEGPHVPLPGELPAGASEIVPLPLEAPAEAGSWTLEVDLVHEHVRWFEQAVAVPVEVLPVRRVAVVDPGTLEGLVAVLEALDAEEEPVVVSDRAGLAREFAGRIVPTLAEAGAGRVVVPEELVREGHRRPLLDLVAAAKKLGIPVHASSGEELTRGVVARRRLR